MKAIPIFFILLLGLTGCYIEIELDPTQVVVEDTGEYETREIVSEVWSNGQWVSSKYINHTWLSIDLYNAGSLKACGVYADIVFYRGYKAIKTISVNIPDIRPGHRYNYTLETGFNSLRDYDDYSVDVYWE
ncbi:MAG: hypothetical protein HC819_11270 [Cyclobacteriaceae bacterium]|nr:hypothetical protein [Cyclobacteriaceae bacterium]